MKHRGIIFLCYTHRLINDASGRILFYFQNPAHQVNQQETAGQMISTFQLSTCTYVNSCAYARLSPGYHKYGWIPVINRFIDENG